MTRPSPGQPQQRQAPELDSVSAQLHVGPVGTLVQAGLGHFQRRLLVPDGLLQRCDIVLLVHDLPQCLHTGQSLWVSPTTPQALCHVEQAALSAGSGGGVEAGRMCMATSSFPWAPTGLGAVRTAKLVAQQLWPESPQPCGHQPPTLVGSWRDKGSKSHPESLGSEPCQARGQHRGHPTRQPGPTSFHPPCSCLQHPLVSHSSDNATTPKCHLVSHQLNEGPGRSGGPASGVPQDGRGQGGAGARPGRDKGIVASGGGVVWVTQSGPGLSLWLRYQGVSSPRGCPGRGQVVGWAWPGGGVGVVWRRDGRGRAAPPRAGSAPACGARPPAPHNAARRPGSRRRTAAASPRMRPAGCSRQASAG